MRKLLLAGALLFGASAFANDFHASVFARGLDDARMLLALDDGTLLVSRPATNDVIALRDRDGDGRADDVRTAVASVERAHGLAMRGRTLYIAGTRRIVSAERLPDGSFAAQHDVVTDLPDGGQHPYRTIGVGPDGKLYVSIGSSCSDCEETNPEHATLLQLDADGSNRRVFARGLSDMPGFAWHPETGDLWGANDRALHRLGDGLRFDDTKPALELPSPSASLVFHQGDAFSATGSKLIRVRYRDGKPAASESIELALDALYGLAAAKDALFASDPKRGIVYRITRGALPPPMTSAAGGEDAPRLVLARAFHLELRSAQAVVHDEEQDVYFVSAGTCVARVDPDGRVADAQFIDGLRAPKGLAIRGTELLVADVDQLRTFDRVTGAVRRTIDLAPHGALSLDDVAVGGDDAIYVIDSDVRVKANRERERAGDGRIYRVEEDGDVEVAFRGEELRSPGGIAWDGTRFLIAQEYGREVVAWRRGGGTKAVLRGPGAFDGIVVLPSGAVIVSSAHDQGLHVAYGDGELRPLFARKPGLADIGFDRKRNRLLIPSPDGNWLEAWTLPPMEPPAQTTARDGRMEFARR